MHPESAHTHEPALEALIQKISVGHGFDIRSYKRSTLYRRIRKRMMDVDCSEADAYLARLNTEPREYEQLLHTILINVTEFFRDPEAWRFLQDACLRPLIQRKGLDEPIRAWCPGCATGEEAYSVAICLAELLGDQHLARVKVYATDVDEAALALARPAVYGPDCLRNVQAERLRRFFDPASEGRFSIKPWLRSSVVFGRQNVLVDPPISRLDLLVCRNLLIYFDAPAQQQVLSRFHYGLQEDGILFLGKAETLMTRSHLFTPLEPRYRVFCKPSAESGLEEASRDDASSPLRSYIRSP